jgi:pimeloyl-ACP methyl ester carboxylesterase
VAQVPGSSLTWRSCRGGFQCARLSVPLDYARPDGAHISLALIRQPARDANAREGSLVINPGGPGASGVDFVAQSGDVLPAEIRDHFDIVGFDPRGVGGSAPVDCHANLDAYFDVNPAPRNATERATLVRASAAVATDCANNAKALLPHVSTVDGARDLDRIRAALGDAKLTYLGWSYGTLLGAWYAQLFPTKVRALVLDGAVDPAYNFVQSSEDQANGFQQIFDSFLAGCPRRATCEWVTGSGKNAAHATYAAMLRRAQDHPMAVTGSRGRTLTAGLFALGVIEAFYVGDQGFGDLDHALTALARGDGRALVALADEYTERGDAGTYSNSNDAYWAVSCLDLPTPRSPSAFTQIAAAAQKTAPDFGAATVNVALVCATWAAPALNPPHALHAPGAPPIVVIGGTSDPVTPYRNAKALAAELDSGVLVTFDTTQHTAYPAGDDCLDPTIDRYFLTTAAPAAGLHCRG